MNTPTTEAGLEVAAWQWRKRLDCGAYEGKPYYCWSEWEALQPPYMDARKLSKTDPENYELRPLVLIDALDSAIAREAATRAEVEALRADAELLDWLDTLNARKNERNGTIYGWWLSENHNRIALEDHDWRKLSVREAIEAARSGLAATSVAKG